MELKESTSVYTVDGKEAGHLDRVVIDPKTKEVTHVVIRSGILSKEDRVISADKIASASQERVTLHCDAEELKEMPPFVVAHYVPVNAGDTHRGKSADETYVSAAPMFYSYPAPERYEISEIKRTIPDELTALKEGAPVNSADNERVGNIERVITHPDTGQVTHFVIAKGLLLKERKLIPIRWVDLLGEDEVNLSVGTHQIKDLPALQD